MIRLFPIMGLKFFAGSERKATRTRLGRTDVGRALSNGNLSVKNVHGEYVVTIAIDLDALDSRYTAERRIRS